MSDDSRRALDSRVGRAIFGDRVGLALFLGSLAFVTLTWRAGLFITDNATLISGLDALSQGRFWLERAGEGAINAPGTTVRDGLVYGRNYGQLVLSLPALWALRALDMLVSLRVALMAAWHLLVLGFVVQVGSLVDRERAVVVGGSAFVLVSFLANLLVVTAFFSPSIPLLALQVTSAVAAGLLGVVIYRLLASRDGILVGVLAGAGSVLAMPVAFWATAPKRHVFSALFVVAIVFAFARSRGGRPNRWVPRLGRVPVYRAAAYVLVGLLTWVHAAEGLFVFLALIAVDLPTAPENGPKTLAFVGGAFALSLVPVFLTNLAVAGEFFRPPRAMGGTTQSIAESPATGGGSASPGSGIWTELWGLFAGTPPGWFFGQVGNVAGASLSSLADPEAVVQTFVHSSIEGIDQDPQFLGVNLAVLEAAPVLGAVVAAVVSVARRIHAFRRVTATDALAVALTVAFILLYASRLPLNTQLTMRYLLPVYPLGAILLARSAVIGRLLADNYRPLLWFYGTGVAIGGQLFFVALVAGNYATAEAARVHALIGLGLGIAVAVITTASVFDDRARTVAAAALGLAGAAATVFFLFATLQYFSFVGEYILPVVGKVSELLAAA